MAHLKTDKDFEKYVHQSKLLRGFMHCSLSL